MDFDPAVDLERSFHAPRKPKPAKWAAVARMGGVGDGLIASSILPLLAADHQVEVIAQRPYHVVFENNPHIAKLTVKSKDDWPAGCGPEWFAWFKQRAKEYDRFVHLSHSCEVSLAMLPSQSQFYWPPAWRRKYCGFSYLEFVHDVAGLPYIFDPRFFPTEGEWEQAVDTKDRVSHGGPVIGWTLAGSRLDKVYPYSGMAVARLIKELNATVLLLGAPGKQVEDAQAISEHVVRTNGDGRGVHIAIAADYAMSSDEDRVRLGLKPGEVNWPLRRVLTMAQACDLVVSPDTGVAWAVAMEAVPKIMLLSHASAKNITAYWMNTVSLQADQQRVPCAPCHMLHDERGTCIEEQGKCGVAKPNEHAASCIADISVETIVLEARRLLGM